VTASPPVGVLTLGSARPVLRAVAAAAAALLAVAVPAAGSPWSAAETVMPALRAGRLPHGNPPGWVALAPAVGVRDDGTAILAWTSRAARRGFVAVRVATRAPGAHWSPARTLGTSKGFPRTGAALSVAGDAMAVAWSARQRIVHAPQIRVWSAGPAGQPPALDGPAATEAGFMPAVVVAPDGGVLTVWQECACPHTYNVAFPGALGWALRSPAGVWSAPGALDPGANIVTWSLAGTAGGAAALGWSDFTGPFGSPVGGGPVQPPPPGGRLALRPPGGGFGPVEIRDGVSGLVVRPDGSPAIVRAGLDDGVVAVSRTAAGWGSDIQLAPAGRSGNPSAAALSDGRLAAAWTEAVGTAVRLYAAVETTPGGAWSAPVQLVASPGGIERLTLAAGPRGSVLLAWTQRRTGRVRSRLLRGGTWEPATDVSPSGMRCDLPALAVGRGGRAVAAFVCGTASPAVLLAERNVG
jgi:hypothetical protein